MPQLILDKQKCLGNIEKMLKKAQKNQLSFRPHCKTHQSAEVGLWLRDFGVSKITVSSFPMASYFAAEGWTDILIAFPFDPGQLPALNALSESVRISILIDNQEILPYLSRIDRQVSFYIDIDTGYGRTGVKSHATQTVESIIKQSLDIKNLSFAGFYCHAGHSYKTTDPVKREELHTKATSDLKQLKEEFITYAPKALYGDTPNCSIQNDFTGIDEITPGNFVFYDLIQLALGACQMEEIAVAVACPVVGKYPEEKRLAIHGGAVHFSKETINMEGKAVFGQMVNGIHPGWESSVHNQYISSISQEHGILEDCGDWMKEIQIGDTLHFLPVHSCLTANLMREYVCTDGQPISTLNSSLYEI